MPILLVEVAQGERLMGSGDRVKFFRSDALGAGFFVARFPFAVTLTAHLLFWCVSIGFGRGYDE
jgi:hypothetical protein